MKAEEILEEFKKLKRLHVETEAFTYHAPYSVEPFVVCWDKATLNVNKGHRLSEVAEWLVRNSL